MAQSEPNSATTPILWVGVNLATFAATFIVFGVVVVAISWGVVYEVPQSIPLLPTLVFVQLVFLVPYIAPGLLLYLTLVWLYASRGPPGQRFVAIVLAPISVAGTFVGGVQPDYGAGIDRAEIEFVIGALLYGSLTLLPRQSLEDFPPHRLPRVLGDWWARRSISGRAG